MTTSTLSPREAFRQAVAQVATKATEKLPECAGRVESAVKLVLNGDVELLPDGSAKVFSQSNGVSSYHIANGHCDCRDYEKAPQQLCKHRLAYGIARRTREMVPQGDPEPATTSQPMAGLDPQHIVVISGKPFVRFAGLLQLSHERGLVSLTADWTYNDAELSLAHAVAIFQDGRRFEESGDATPANTNRKVAVHFRRVALTRAKARVLRDALGVDLVAVEELADE